MNHQIYNYLDKYHISRCTDGYELLARVIALAFQNNNYVSIRTCMDQVAADAGITHAQLRSRIRYVLYGSDAVSTEYKSVNRFVRNALLQLRCEEENSHVS